MDDVEFKTDASFGLIPIRERDGRREYLLVLHNKGHWSFPKGHPEPGETPIDAARREVAEETGLDDLRVDESREFVEEYEFVSKSGQAVRKRVVYYVGLTDEGQEVRLQEDEVADYRWADGAATRAAITFDESRSLFDEVLAYFNGK